MNPKALKWFYQTPENTPYLIGERLNATFWDARIVAYTWRCTRAESPYEAVGYGIGETVRLAWEPGQWLALTFSGDHQEDHPLNQAITRRILGFKPSITYQDHGGNQIIEWHTDGGQKRWSAIQGHPEIVLPERL